MKDGYPSALQLVKSRRWNTCCKKLCLLLQYFFFFHFFSFLSSCWDYMICSVFNLDILHSLSHLLMVLWCIASVLTLCSTRRLDEISKTCLTHSVTTDIKGCKATNSWSNPLIFRCCLVPLSKVFLSSAGKWKKMGEKWELSEARYWKYVCLHLDNDFFGKQMLQMKGGVHPVVMHLHRRMEICTTPSALGHAIGLPSLIWLRLTNTQRIT